MSGDRPVSPQQAAQLLADLVFRRRDPDFFDHLWPHLQMALLIVRAGFEWRNRFCPYELLQAATVVSELTDSPRPFALHHRIEIFWPLEQFRRN